jgi:hypothetical protein
VRAEVADRVDDAEDDVHGMTRDDLRSRHVIRIVLAALGRAAALPRDAAVARARAQVERALSPWPRHYRQIYMT